VVPVKDWVTVTWAFALKTNPANEQSAAKMRTTLLGLIWGMDLMRQSSVSAHERVKLIGGYP
jgi:hypothetical protein